MNSERRSDQWIGGGGSPRVYGAEARKHPPNLTRTERPRFIRFWYQMWGMMNLDTAEWQSRLQLIKLKDLYYLCEMCNLGQNFGREAVLLNPNTVHALTGYRPVRPKLSTLGHTIWEHIDLRYQNIYNQRSDYPWIYAKHEGRDGFVIMWDHWQECLKDIVCGGPRPSPGEARLWEDSSDEQVTDL